MVPLFVEFSHNRDRKSWGVSAGAMSAALHMVTNGGNNEGLFRGAFMQSGAVIPRGDIALGQQDYDDFVRAAGCTSAEDTLECLRQVPYPVLKAAVNKCPDSFSYRVCRAFIFLLNSDELYFPVSEHSLGPQGGWHAL